MLKFGALPASGDPPASLRRRRGFAPSGEVPPASPCRTGFAPSGEVPPRAWRRE